MSMIAWPVLPWYQLRLRSSADGAELDNQIAGQILRGDFAAALQHIDGRPLHRRTEDGADLRRHARRLELHLRGGDVDAGLADWISAHVGPSRRAGLVPAPLVPTIPRSQSSRRACTTRKSRAPMWRWRRITARRKPRDKANVEQAVLVVAVHPDYFVGIRTLQSPFGDKSRAIGAATCGSAGLRNIARRHGSRAATPWHTVARDPRRSPAGVPGHSSGSLRTQIYGKRLGVAAPAGSWTGLAAHSSCATDNGAICRFAHHARSLPCRCSSS
ncbi:hypothetical protein SAMN05216525_1406 [Bradyrhizobium sp. Gha]|nr:hypothetical protein SAMN05216525_1406 [Bradyrhizobium sp. Gha]